MATDFESEYVEVTPGSLGLGLKARLMVAAWFAGSACIPVLFFFVFSWAISSNSRFDAALWFIWLFAAIPISSAALLGFIFGCQIVDPYSRITSGRAALRGMALASFSFVLTIVACGMLAAVSTNLSWSDSLVRSAEIMFLTFIFGFFVVGWLVVIIGALAGWLLYRVSSKDSALFLKGPDESMATAKLSIAIAILLFLMNCASLLLFGRPGKY